MSQPFFGAACGSPDPGCCNRARKQSFVSPETTLYSIAYAAAISFEMAYGMPDALKLWVVHKKHGIDMKSKWLLGFVVASALSAPAFGQIQIYIGAPPPPIRYEAPPPPPAEVGFVWTAGFWEPHGPHYRWVPGRYVRAPYPGAHWTPAHYEHGDKGWRMHEGYWEHKGNPHFDHDHDHGHGHDRD
jgi:WXXGXW repeat (2 copies)